MNALLLFIIVVLANGNALKEDQKQNTTEVKLPQGEQKDLTNISYIENFKNIISGNLSSEYKYLTTNETEKVETVLDDFIEIFEHDLIEIITLQDEYNNEFSNKEDNSHEGTYDEMFDKIKEVVKNEFADVSEGTAREIVSRLRKNFISTRQKLEHIIKESKRKPIDNS